jgi:23S rRNA (cytosine1962-C5)-methyltransferase
VDVIEGQKTGFYLDQRENRRQCARWVGKGDRVLDGFCYTGAFTVVALGAGAADVTSIDSSADALGLARRAVDLNQLDGARCQWVNEDVFSALRSCRDRAERFDVIVLDPPKFAPTPSHVDAAARGYKDINLLAFKLLHAGGRLVTFSCSGGVSPELFQKIVADAALDAGVQASVVGWLGQPEDHPVALNFPEARYLKGLIVRVEQPAS